MIVRIMGEGQYEVDDSLAASLNKLDSELESALAEGREDDFHRILEEMIAEVRLHGRLLDTNELVASAAILPPSDATAEQLKELLGEEGLIPG